MRGLKNDLRERFDVAYEEGRFLVPVSASDARRLSKALQRGDTVRVARRVYALPEHLQDLAPAERELFKIRALHELHPDWVFAGPSAAVAYGLYVSYRLLGSTHVMTSRETHSRSTAGIVRHIIGDDPVTRVNDIPVTSLVRTAFDCMRSADFRAALAIADSTLRASGMGRDELAREMGRFDYHERGRQRAVAIAGLADGLSESGGESTARAVMYEQGLMIPTLQKQVRDPVDSTRTYRVDFYWQLPGGNVAGELDGREKYRNPLMTGGRDAVEVLADERLRESRLTGSKDVDKVVRFSFADVVNAPRFRRLLTRFGIPSGYEVPWVARVPNLRTQCG